MLREIAADRLRRELTRQGKTTAELAKASRLDVATVRKLLRGESWKLDYLDACAEALGVEPVALLGGTVAGVSQEELLEAVRELRSLSPEQLKAILTIVRLQKRRSLSDAVEVRAAQ